jgi:hypothetical protein
MFRTITATNTAVDVHYQDADGFWTRETVVFSGRPSWRLNRRLRKAMHAGRAVVAEQVGLVNPGRQHGFFAGDFPAEGYDHGWVELNAAATSHPATDVRSFEQFVADCQAAAREGWDEQVCIAAAGGWNPARAGYRVTHTAPVAA